MVHFTRSIALSAIGTVGMVSLLALTGCSNSADKATSEASPSAMAASPGTAASPDAMAASPGASPAMSGSAMSGSAMSGSAMSNSKTAGMKQVVASTTAAVEAGDFAKAKTEFGQLEGHWSKIEDGVKEKSSDTYNKIEDTTTAVNSALKESQPSKDKTLAALKSLDEAIAGADK